MNLFLDCEILKKNISTNLSERLSLLFCVLAAKQTFEQAFFFIIAPLLILLLNMFHLTHYSPNLDKKTRNIRNGHRTKKSSIGITRMFSSLSLHSPRAPIDKQIFPIVIIPSLRVMILFQNSHLIAWFFFALLNAIIPSLS